METKERTALRRWLGLADALADGLAGAEAELAALAGEQARCAATIGEKLHQLEGTGLPADQLATLVAALQAEDHIRQHQEQVALLLARLRAEVESLAGANEGDGAFREAVAARLLAGLPLEAMRGRLAARLAGTAPPPSPDGGGDVELF